MQSGKFEEAIADFSEAMALQPKIDRAYEYRANCYFQLHQYENAVNDLRNVVREDPSDPRAHRNLELAYQKLGLQKLAEREHEELARLDITPADMKQLGIARRLKKDGMYTATLKILNGIIERNPKSERALFYRASTYSALQRWNQVISDCNVMLKLNPTSENALRLRGTAYYESENFGKSLIDANKLIQLYPKSLEGYAIRVNVCKTEGRFSDAINGYSQEIKLNGSDGQLYFKRGELYERQGKLAEALEDYASSLKCNPRADSPRLRRGALFLKLSQFQNALSEYDKLAAVNSLDEEAYKGKGDAYMGEHDYQRAAQSYSQAIKLDPANAWRNLEARAAAYDKLGMKDLAAADRKSAAAFAMRNSGKH